jgi:hypothetical protein
MSAEEPVNRPTIAELEAILNRDDEQSIEILPNGEIRAVGSPDAQPKPLTMREHLGGEYSAASTACDLCHREATRGLDGRGFSVRACDEHYYRLLVILGRPHL